jgi:two-component system, LuxR family, sensor kinase FixL
MASSILTLALLHLVVWFKQRQQLAHLFFSIAAIGVAVISGLELMGMRSDSIDQMALLMRWVQLPLLAIWIATVCYVRCFNAGRLWLAWTVCSLRVFVLILNFTIGQNLFFSEITRLKQVAIFGGETITIAEGVLNPCYMIGFISMLALVVYVVDAAVTLWHQGTDNARRRAVIFCCIAFFLLASVSHSVLVNSGLIDSPYLISIAFMPTLFAMSYELSYDVLHSAKVAQNLQISESELRRSEQRMELAMTAAELGLWEWDIVHDHIWCTDQARVLYGIPKTEPIGFERFLKTLHKEDYESTRLAITALLAGCGKYEGEYRVMLPNGQIRWLAVRSRIECNDQQQPMRMCGVSLDITKRKQVELDMQKQRNALTHLSRVTLLGELSGSLAHELNQPLAAILSNAQAAQRFLAPENINLDEVRDILQDIVDEDKRAADIIQRLRIILKKADLQLQPLNVNEVVQDVLKLVHSDLRHRSVIVNSDLSTNIPLVMGDKVLIQQVLLNLIMNACDASTDAGVIENHQIHIHTLWNGTATQVIVSDYGTGILSDDMERIFEPFFTTKPQGMGLGLAICRTIIHAHKGQLWAENNSEGSASFYFTLPVYSGKTT